MGSNQGSGPWNAVGARGHVCFVAAFIAFIVLTSIPMELHAQAGGVLSPGDRVEIVVPGHPSASGVAEVRADGALVLPGLDGMRVRAAGRTLAAVQADAAAIYERMLRQGGTRVAMAGERPTPVTPARTAGAAGSRPTPARSSSGTEFIFDLNLSGAMSGFSDSSDSFEDSFRGIGAGGGFGVLLQDRFALLATYDHTALWEVDGRNNFNFGQLVGGVRLLANEQEEGARPFVGAFMGQGRMFGELLGQVGSSRSSESFEGTGSTVVFELGVMTRSRGQWLSTSLQYVQSTLDEWTFGSTQAPSGTLDLTMSTWRLKASVGGG